LERCRRGDDLAWEALVRRYQGRVFGVTLQYLRNREEARDVAQEVFVKLYQRLGSLREDEALLAWLIRLARNCCIDRRRRLQVRTPEGEVSLDGAAEVPAREPSPEARTLVSAREKLLYRALDTLDETSREMILLKEIQELKLKEIAEMLALPLGTVKSRSHRARLELAEAVRAIDPAYPGRVVQAES
jgi:RNA polymerase sigma-70 factor (ECF subfamily)